MAKFTHQQFEDIMHSDGQLWGKADAGVVTPALREELGLDDSVEGIVKIIDAPQLGGREVWIFPADTKDNFMAFGPMVRDKVKERENEIAEAALMERNRAELRAAEASENAGGSDAERLGEDERVARQPALAVASTETVSPPEIAFTAGADFACRRDELVAAISQLNSYITEAIGRRKRYSKELTAIFAALEIMNAPEDDGAEPDDAETTVEGPR